MIKDTELVLSPAQLNDSGLHRKKLAWQLKVGEYEITGFYVLRRSIDSRAMYPVYRTLFRVFINEPMQERIQSIDYKPVPGGAAKKEAIIIGFGPAGMFAALRLIELGVRPIILERGKDVQTRRRDIKALQIDHFVNPDSNYCFGEGGAGTYSDGKIYTRSTKRGNVGKILDILVQHGASEDILIEAHPHIGSNKLPKIIENIRNTILNSGGEIHFNCKVSDFITEKDALKGVRTSDGKEFLSKAAILAAGHSARDIFELLYERKIALEFKPYALGVRIEHPQQLINEIRYHTIKASENLPAASYNLACQVDGAGVFSFCMCPGGIIIPSATQEGELVVNGMSVSKRDSPFANAGFVVEINQNSVKDIDTEECFKGLEFQKQVERAAFLAGGGNQTAPAQRVTDFINNKVSSTLPKASYKPGTVSAPLHEILPQYIVTKLQQGLIEFDKKMNGYLTEEAQILAPESRTSSPIRIVRDKESKMSVSLAGLFPAGEGAGYAGGIISSAMDGENSANSVATFLKVR